MRRGQKGDPHSDLVHFSGFFFTNLFAKCVLFQFNIIIVYLRKFALN